MSYQKVKNLKIQKSKKLTKGFGKAPNFHNYSTGVLRRSGCVRERHVQTEDGRCEGRQK